MATYSAPDDCHDPMLNCIEADCEQADVWLAAQLWAKGIDPAHLTASLPLDLLTRTAAAYALYVRALAEQHGVDDAVQAKISGYLRQAQDLAKGITRSSLGLVADGSTAGYGSITLGRG